MTDNILTPEEVARRGKVATACGCTACRAHLTWIASYRALAARIKELEDHLAECEQAYHGQMKDHD